MEALIYRAKVLEKAEFYEEMAKTVKLILSGQNSDETVTDEMKSLFAVAYKHYIDKLRRSWRVLDRLLAQSPQTLTPEEYSVATHYCQEIETQLGAICDDLFLLIQPFLDTAVSTASKAFWLKSKADFKRYLAELPFNEKEQTTKESVQAYEEALRNVASSNPLHYSIALNFAILYRTILNDEKKGDEILSETLKAAKKHFPDEHTQPVIVYLIEENIKLWAA